MGFLANKRILITGMISTRSIAYGIAQSMHREGACLAFTYQGERVRERVLGLAKEFDSDLVFQCDVANDTVTTKNTHRSSAMLPLRKSVMQRHFYAAIWPVVSQEKLLMSMAALTPHHLAARKNNRGKQA